MACFAAPAAAALVAQSLRGALPRWLRLEWLLSLLWGGVAMLVVEHIAHGEIVPFPPFFTAMQSATATAAMLREIGTVGTGMTAAILGLWSVLILCARRIEASRAGHAAAVPAPRTCGS